MLSKNLSLFSQSYYIIALVKKYESRSRFLSDFAMKKPPKPPLSTEDTVLWQKVAKTVRPQKPAKKIEPALKNKPPKADKSSITPPSPPPAARAHTTGTPAAAPPPPVQDDGTARALRKGKWEIDKKIDLHGMTQVAAKAALEKFILSAQKQDKRTLLIITGKGSRGTGGGILRRMLPHWLELPPLKGIALALTPARPEDGGEGAFYLRLRKKKIIR
jgi:DNA-nicking Smr family endonuclease